MGHRILLAVTTLFAVATVARAGDGMITLESPHDVKTTADRLETALQEKGMTVFDRIDHAGGAEQAGLELAPTVLVIFGNPKVGTPLMHCGRSAAIDLPQKALIWEDEGGKVRLSYNDPQYLAKRHGIEGCEKVLNKIEKALGKFAEAAVAP
jgi:uncharacterized protein (DUF302 family)